MFAHFKLAAPFRSLLIAGTLALVACSSTTETPDKTAIAVDDPAPKEEAKVEVAKADPSAPPKKHEVKAPTTLADAIPRAVLFSDPEVSSVQLSPDGRSLAWLAPKGGVRNVFVAKLSAIKKKKKDPASAGVAITEDTGRGIHRYLWTPDSKSLLYLQDAAGDENWRLFIVDVKKKKVRALTPTGDKAPIRANILKVTAKNKKDILITHNARNPARFDPYKLSLKKGKLTLLEENERFTGYFADDKLKLRLATTQNKDGDTEVFIKKKKKWELLFKVALEDQMPFNIVGFDKKGKKAYLVDSTGKDTGALIELDLKKNKRKVLAEGDKADISIVLVNPKTKKVDAVASEYERRAYTAVDKKFAKHLKALKKLGDGDAHIVSRSAKDTKWVVAMDKADAPVEYFLYDVKKKKGTPLFVSNAALADKKLVPVLPRVINARDKLPLVSYLALPKGTDPEADGVPKEPLPMVLLVHGGPWSRDRWGYSAYTQWLADRGYAVLRVNFRGSTGFGKAFVNAGDKEWARKMHDDLIDATKWAIDQKIADPDRVAIMGGSYGGYATLVGLSFTPETFACGVDIVGPANLETLLNSVPPYWKPIFETFAKRIGDPRTDAGKRLLAERSPLTRAKDIKRPLLIAQGANDPRVKQAESDQIVGALKANNIPVTYLLYPDEGHGFRRPPNRLAFSAAAEHFLGNCLGGGAEPYGSDLAGSSVIAKDGGEDVFGLTAAIAARDKKGNTPKMAMKKDEPKKDEPVKDEPKKDEPVKDEPKKDEPKKDEPVKDEPKKDDPKKDDEPKVAKAEDVGDAGLPLGDIAPGFRLPVVNSVKETMTKWGPADWGTGENRKKLIVMSFFATWCEPCKEEMPELVKLHKKYADKGLGIALVSIDKGMDQRDEVVKLAEKIGVPFPVVHDRFQVVAKRYEASRLPYMLMFGPDRKIHTKHVGYTDEVKAGLEAEIKKHLGL